MCTILGESIKSVYRIRIVATKRKEGGHSSEEKKTSYVKFLFSSCIVNDWEKKTHEMQPDSLCVSTTR